MKPHTGHVNIPTGGGAGTAGQKVNLKLQINCGYYKIMVPEIVIMAIGLFGQVIVIIIGYCILEFYLTNPN